MTWADQGKNWGNNSYSLGQNLLPNPSYKRRKILFLTVFHLIYDKQQSCQKWVRCNKQTFFRILRWTTISYKIKRKSENWCVLLSNSALYICNMDVTLGIWVINTHVLYYTELCLKWKNVSSLWFHYDYKEVSYHIVVKQSWKIFCFVKYVTFE